MEQFKSISYSFNTRTKRYTFVTKHVKAIKKALIAILGKSGTGYLMVKEKSNSFDIYEFFLLELYYCFKLIEDEEHMLGVDIGGVLLMDFLEFLETQTWLANRFKKHKKFNLNLIKRTMKYMPLKHQLDSFKKYEEIKDNAGLNGMLMDAGVGSGKFQPLDALIKIPNGWKKMGDIKVGDVVIGRDGQPTNVTQIHPNGVKKMYNVEFADGRSTKVGLEHLWTVIYSSEDTNGKFLLKRKVMNTAAIIEYLENKKKTKYPTSQYHIDLVTPEDFGEVDLPVDPYVLGVLLGDGHMKSLKISNVSDHILNMVAERLPSNIMIKRTDGKSLSIKYKDLKDKSYNLKYELSKLGLINTHAWEKFIPPEYFIGSVEQRYELLKGLMDTDGEAGKNGGLSYSTSSEQLAKDMQLLIRGLGNICSISTRYTYYTYKGEKKRGRLSYRLNMRMKEPTRCITLPKRLERVKKVNQYSKNLRLRIDKITEVEEAEAQCITIDNADSLYVTNDYIVTHNCTTEDTPVKTKYGWKKMGDIKLGDKVIGQDGKETKVVGVYPQGVRRIFRVTFEDGRFADVDLEHQWSIINKSKKSRRKTMVTKDMITLMSDNNELHIDLIKPSNFAPLELPIEPYLIGLILGGLNLSNLSISSKNKPVLNLLDKSLPAGYTLYNYKQNKDTHFIKPKDISNPSSISIYHELFKMDIFNKTNTDRYIPSMYLEGSLEQREDILKGLLDINSSIDKNGSISFKTTSNKLANSISLLVRSLGGICYLSKSKSSDKHDTVYTLNLKLKYPHKYFSLKSKLNKLKEPSFYNNLSTLKITKIYEIASAKAQCISVDNKNKLYVIKDYIVTHNTYISLALMELLEYDTVIILAPKNTLEEVWLKSVTETLFKHKQTAIIMTGNNPVYNNEKFIITNYEYVDKLMNNKKLNRRLKRLKPSLIIDEQHNFSEMKTKRTNLLFDFVNYYKFTDILLLTGTPVKMKLGDLKPMLKILDPKYPKIADVFDYFYKGLNSTKIDLLQYRFNLYRERIENKDPSMPEIELDEYRIPLKNGDYYTLENINKRMTEYKLTRLKELHNKMDFYQDEFSIILEDLNKNLNKEERDNLKRYKVLVKLIRKKSDANKLYEVYDAVNEATYIEKNLINKKLDSISKVKFKDLKSIVKYPKLKVLGEALGKILLGSRIQCYKELALNLDYKNLMKLTFKKTLIFSNYVSVCENAKNVCKLQGYNPIPVYGTYINDLTKNVKLFNDLETDVNPIIATYKSLSTGVPLTSANVVILLDTPLRSYILEQAIARSFRIGNYHKVLVFFIRLDTGPNYNITERDLYIVNQSTNNVEMITGNTTQYDVPIQELPSLEEEIDEGDLKEEDLPPVLKDEIEEEVTNSASFIDKTTVLNLEFIKSFIKKIKIV